MSVIIDRNMPENGNDCHIRPKGCESKINLHRRAKDCPLKSTDEMIAEIDNLQFIQTEMEYNGAIKKVISKNDVLEIINKYCKENTDE